ncbi:MAG: hypothetical protein Q7S58_17705 [Candidatus Binatus sp.]|uniref:hypothetical protein n=1 Tax=Candidatus Binatus sp. TaxID=2811406 RepID=UPI0027278F5E|nr:hypothetical protein [Candidatus Binatus sp.]MDO8434239.1 hypothetical protein [Candidatus Binatus sp.]
MNAKPSVIERHHYARGTIVQRLIGKRCTTELRNAPVGQAAEPHWDILYSPNDARRDLIAFSIALAITLMTLALTNCGILK